MGPVFLIRDTPNEQRIFSGLNHSPIRKIEVSDEEIGTDWPRDMSPGRSFRTPFWHEPMRQSDIKLSPITLSNSNDDR